MDALKWLERKKLERIGRAEEISSLVASFMSIVILVGIWWLADYMLPKFNAPELRIFLLSIILLSIFADPSSYSFGFTEFGRTRWFLSLPIPHKRFVGKPLWEKSASVFVVLVVLAAMSLAWGKKLHAVTLSGSTVAIVALFLTSIIVASLSLVSFSFRNSHGWRRFVGLAIYALFVLFVVGVSLSIASGASPETAQRSKIADSALRWLIIFALFPSLPVFAAMKAVTGGVTVKMVAWLVGYAHFAALTFAFAMKRAPEFCEAVFLEASKRPMATVFGAIGQIRSKKRVRSKGFGKGASTLLWLHWLSLRRNFVSLALGLLIGVVLFTLVYEGKFGKAIAVAIPASFGWVLVWGTMMVSSCVFNPLLKPLPLSGRQVMLHWLTFSGLIAVPISVIFAFAVKPYLSQPIAFSLPATILALAGLAVLGNLAISAISVFDFGTNVGIFLPACLVALCSGLVLFLALQGHEWAWWLMPIGIWFACFLACRQAADAWERWEPVKQGSGLSCPTISQFSLWCFFFASLTHQALTTFGIKGATSLDSLIL